MKTHLGYQYDGKWYNLCGNLPRYSPRRTVDRDFVTCRKCLVCLERGFTVPAPTSTDGTAPLDPAPGAGSSPADHGAG